MNPDNSEMQYEANGNEEHGQTSMNVEESIDYDQQIKECMQRQKAYILKINRRQKENEDTKMLIKEINKKLKFFEEGGVHTIDPLQNPLIEREYQELRKLIAENDKTIERNEIYNIYRLPQYEAKKIDLHNATLNENSYRHEFIKKEYEETLREDIRQNEAKVIKLKQQLNTLNDEIKQMEGEYTHQDETISFQKKMLSDSKEKMKRLKEENSEYRNKTH